MKGKGYGLSRPLLLLNAQQIKQLQTSDMPPVLVQHITDSTNLQLMQMLYNNTSLVNGAVVVAEAQTAGRGRRGRSWYSPFGTNLYFSYYWKLEQGVHAAMGLSLVVGCALCSLLRREYQVAAQVKWPNDIYFDGRKLAGILVELAGQADAACNVIIGIGLNIDLPENAMQYINQPYTDLTKASGQVIDRNQLIVQLQKELTLVLSSFELRGFKPFQQTFNRYDFFSNRQVTLNGATNAAGICLGVNENGAILLEIDGEMQAFYGGELSLRASV